MDMTSLRTEALLQRTRAFRSDEPDDAGEIFLAARELSSRNHKDEARLVAQKLAHLQALPAAQSVLLIQQWALWTSQNPDTPDDSKHEEGLDILEKWLPPGLKLSQTTDPETLGIAGGICKRMWGVDGQRRTLERALAYYERGAQAGVAADNGYTAINAAFLHDMVAGDAAAVGEFGDITAKHRERAAQLRRQVRDELLPLADQPAREGALPRRNQAFFWETLAEAHFGLRDYAGATAHLVTAHEVHPPAPWEREATARQFAALARLHEPNAHSIEDFKRSAAWQVLLDVYGGNATAGAGSLFAGKLGLSLSGGGFRASLFHIGVLAALAERDLLRHVEVLSCVSGGSILGAHYYLEVRNLLQSKSDDEITRQDWIELVERVARDFLAGVQKNLRVRIGTNVWANLRMLFQPGYTPTSRLSELYEEHLFARVKDDGERRLRELRIRPKGDESVMPKYDNWRRGNKVPILILNATSLNTGHNWQFTTSWMGEPPSAIESQVDGNYRLRRMYIQEAPAEHQDIRIGAAAAASACVPGLFTPLELRGLYPDITVRLVDGGVHDNQGIFGLLDQNCSVMLVSDASGQMATDDQPTDGPLGVLLRTVSLLQARVRVACFREIESRRKSGRLRGMLYLHLKRGLEVQARDWENCNNRKELSETDQEKVDAALTDYRVVKRVQALLSGIRTDLDSFSDVEAYALMSSGCNMLRASIDDAITGFSTHPLRHDWHFLRVAEAMRDESRSRSLLETPLAAGALGMFRMFTLSRPLKVLAGVSGLALAAALLYALYLWHGEPFLSWKGLAAGLAMGLVSVVAGRLGLGLLVKVAQYRKTLFQVLLGCALSSAGWLLLGLHLKLLDPLFLRRGAKAAKTPEAPSPR
ncbi:MAG: patatin-like phospholipase family protein [Burkholderiales bacterium]|jgi:predicted acylesterase/phospholipase RssA|nr:patatin-like phospholipase family protein [Burkholderiales bacterium]